jgi:hypothetical protein
LNQSYITEKFCINKDNPKLSCNGKCHLKNQLVKQEEKEQKAPLNIKESWDYFFICDANVTIFNSFKFRELTCFKYYFLEISEIPFSFFQPPRV